MLFPKMHFLVCFLSGIYNMCNMTQSNLKSFPDRDFFYFKIMSFLFCVAFSNLYNTVWVLWTWPSGITHYITLIIVVDWWTFQAQQNCQLPLSHLLEGFADHFQPIRSDHGQYNIDRSRRTWGHQGNNVAALCAFYDRSFFSYQHLLLSYIFMVCNPKGNRSSGCIRSMTFELDWTRRKDKTKQRTDPSRHLVLCKQKRQRREGRLLNGRFRGKKDGPLRPVAEPFDSILFHEFWEQNINVPLFARTSTLTVMC